MKLGCLLFGILCLISPASSQYESQDTQTLRGRLILVDRDFRTGQESSRIGSAPLGDRHYLLVGYKDSVWGLSFQPGRQPPPRPGMVLEVKVLASELKAAPAASSPDGGSRRLSRGLIGTGGSASEALAHLRNSTCQNLGEPCKGPHNTAIPQLNAGDSSQHQSSMLASNPNIKENLAGQTAGGFEGNERHADIGFDGGRLLAEGDMAQQRYGVGQLTVVSWRQVSTDMAGQDVDTRESSMIKDQDPNSFVYNDDGRIVMDDVSTVVYILNMCGHGLAASREDLEAIFFGEDDVTLQSYLSYCSSGMARFSRRNVLIVGPLELPCSGPYMYYYDGDPDGVEAFWYTSSCRPRDYMGWLRYAQQWARDQGHDIDAYRHHVILGSPDQEQWMVDGDGLGANCDWSGLAFIGPDKDDSNPDPFGRLLTFQRGVYGYAWINGNYWYSATAWAHEIAHNYYLNHATELGCEYCDATCAMGFCCDMRCFNAPHMMQLGWREPLETYDFRSLPVGMMVQRSLSGSGSNPPQGSAMRIEANLWWDSAALTTLKLYEGLFLYTPYVWVSYRKASPPFDNLPVDQLNHVSIYVIYVDKYSGATSGTIKLGTMQAGQVWRNVGLGLHVHVLRISSTNRASDFATVRFCRMESEVEDSGSTCFDGVDNDCDGFIDQEDPDCSSLLPYNPDDPRDYVVPNVITPVTSMDLPPPPFSPDGPDALTPGIYVPLPPRPPAYPIDSAASSRPPDSPLGSDILDVPPHATPKPPMGLYTAEPWPAPLDALWSSGPFELRYAQEPDAPGAPSLTRQPPQLRAAESREVETATVPGLYGGGYYPSVGVLVPSPSPPQRLEPPVEHNRRMAVESQSARASPRGFTPFHSRLGVEESEVHGADVRSVTFAQQPLPPAPTSPSLTSSSSSSGPQGEPETPKPAPDAATAIQCSGQDHCTDHGKQVITRPYRTQLRGAPPPSTGSRTSSPRRLG